MSAWTAAVAALPTQPVVWWRMDATAVTTGAQSNSGSSGASDPGTPGDPTIPNFTGSFNATSLLVGDSNAAISFTGSSGNDQDCVACPADATHLQPTAAISVACLIKPTTIDVTNGSMLACYVDPSSGAAWGLWITATGTLHFFFDSPGSVNRDLISAGTVVNGQTYLIVFTYDGTTMKFYKNAVQDANTTAISTTIYYGDTSGPSLIVGGWGNAFGFAGTTNYNGELDEFLFLNYALTQAQVSALYTGAQGGAAVPHVALFQDSITAKPRRNAEGWAFASGVSISGPSPKPFITPPPMESFVKGRYNANGWAWSGVYANGPSPFPVTVVLESSGKGRYNAEGWFAVSGVHLSGPAPLPIVPLFDINIVTQKRRTDGWYAALVTVLHGPSPQPLAVVMDAYVKGRYNAEGFFVATGVHLVGPSPHFVPQQPDIRTKPRYNSEAWYAMFGNGISGPQPGPSTKNVAVSDTGATISDTVKVTKPGGTGGGPVIIPFFRGF
jgi:Concanavalin A-like lectin/glucanases superfamily